MIETFPHVSIIIINWNSWKDTIECLESVFQLDYPNFDVILVDNHSKDDSVEKIIDYTGGNIPVSSPFQTFDEENKPLTMNIYHEDDSGEIKLIKNDLNIDTLNIQKSDNSKSDNSKSDNSKLENSKSHNHQLNLIKTVKNHGFSGGNNLGIDLARKIYDSSYIFILNNDTVIDKAALSMMVQLGESKPEVAVVGAKVYYYDYNGEKNVIQSTGGTINFLKYPGYFPLNARMADDKGISNEKNKSHDLIVDWTTGAALMFKNKEFKDLKLNPDFFFGCEDVDLCLKLQKQNYKIMVALDAKIWHKGGVARDKKYSTIAKENVNLKTNLKFLRKNNKYFYIYLPMYLPFIVTRYMKALKII